MEEAQTLTTKMMNEMMDKINRQSVQMYQSPTQSEWYNYGYNQIRYGTWDYSAEYPSTAIRQRAYTRTCRECLTMETIALREGDAYPSQSDITGYTCVTCKDKIRLMAEKAAQHKKNLYRVFWNVFNKKGEHPWKNICHENKK